MKAIAASANIIDITSGICVPEKIEICGRTCYKSEDKITDGSAEKFVSALIKSGHEAMLEHGSFILECDFAAYKIIKATIDHLSDIYGFKCFLNLTNRNKLIVSGNVRAFRDFFKKNMEVYGNIHTFFGDFIEKNKIFFPEFKCWSCEDNGKISELMITDLTDRTEVMTHCYPTVKFTVDRAVANEIIRHRSASFAQESTRYCNYTKKKFGKELTFIIPCFWSYKSDEWSAWEKHMKEVETTYFDLIDRCGCTPEEARSVLPNCLKTELIMTANIAEWHHFFELRACDKTGKAHPQMKEVAVPLLKEFQNTFRTVFDDLGC